MLALVRIGLQVVIFFLLLSIVVGIAAPETGAAEKAALGVLAVALAWVAAHARRIGVRRPTGA